MPSLYGDRLAVTLSIFLCEGPGSHLLGVEGLLNLVLAMNVEVVFILDEVGISLLAVVGERLLGVCAGSRHSIPFGGLGPHLLLVVHVVLLQALLAYLHLRFLIFALDTRD
mmetsp:Transcript_28985/g.27943  ORF Transcript_28985/g.27943 Transcript_28985/m.27943 type:complete len:111 (+) Transcript_28985:299-631(+)